MDWRRVRIGFVVMVVVALACVSCSAPNPAPTEPDGGNRVVHRDVRVITGVDASHQVITEELVEIVPPETEDDATLNITLEVDPDHPVSLGMEGADMFVSAFAADGSVVMDRMIAAFGGTVAVPEGDYLIRVYYRPCDANCGLLDPPQAFCRLEQVLTARKSYEVTVKVRDASASVCSAAET